MKMVVLLASTLLAAGCADQRSGVSSSAPATPTAGTQRAEIVQPSADIRDAQQRLRELGLYHGPVDGLWGPDTQIAVERYQRERGLLVTARLDQPTQIALRDAFWAPVAISDPTDVRTLQNRLRQLNFFHGNADGIWGPDTQIAVENFQRARGLPVGQLTQATLAAMGFNVASFPSRPSPGVAMSPIALDRHAVRNVQQRLRQLGYYRLATDGVWGPATQSALQEFQRSRGIEPTGQLNPITVSALGLDPNHLGARSAAWR